MQKYKIVNVNPVTLGGKDYLFLNLQTEEFISANVTVPAEDYAKYRPGWYVRFEIPEATKE